MLKIEPVIPFYKPNILPQNKNSKTAYKNNQTNVISGIPRSYISFRAETNPKFTADGAAFIEKAQNIALENGHDEITPYHIIQAAIEEYEQNPETDNMLKQLAVNYANQELETPSLKEYFRQSVEILKEENEKGLSQLVQNINNTKPDKLPLSEDLKKQLEDNSGVKADSYTILEKAFAALAAANVEYPVEFMKDFISLTYYKTSKEINADYLKSYDNRALEVWNKLALGSNLFVTYSNIKEADRITASLVRTLNAPKHGNFNNKNTLLYAMSDNVTPAEAIEEMAGVIDSTPDKQKIFLINMDNLLIKSVKLDSGELLYPTDMLSFVNTYNKNVKFVFFQNENSYYNTMQNPLIKKGFSDFISYSIPPVHTYEAQEILNKNRKFTKDIKVPFSKDARNKTVAYADKLDGIFPDKAVDLMKRISDYYGSSKKKINTKDVDEFAAVAKDIFKQDNDSTNIIYDTGKNLSSLYGKDTTKKDIEAIVRQIKTGKIGTCGYVMYSEDEEAGSGRRFTAQALAGEAKVPFIEIASSDFALSALDEDGSRTKPSEEMKRIFTEAKKAAEQNEYKSAIIYVNNFEDFAFSGPYLAGYKQAMAQMEKEMAKAESEKLNIVVIGSTSSYYADAIPLVVRGFNRQIAIDSPAFNKNSRKEIIINRIKEVELPLACKNAEERINLINKLVKLTEYMSFVEIKSMIEKTGQIMLERGKTKASMGDFIEAYLQLTTGRTSRPEMPEYNKRATTAHECGHAVNLEVMNDILREKGRPWHQSRDVNFITLDPRGNFLGAVFEGRSENSDYPFEAMFTGLVCAYGGYSAEKLFFDMDGSSGISQDLAQASSSAKRGIEYFGFGYNTGKISNAAGIKSVEYSENVFKDMNVILKNAQMASDLITETYKGFNKWFTDKYSKLIGTDDCMIDGDSFRALLAKWKTAQPEGVKEEFEILGDMIMDIIKSSKKGKIYGKLKA